MFMRHGKAGWPDAAVDDHDRKLNKRGRLATAEMAERITQKYKVPDCIVSSTAKRAVETAKIFAEEVGYDGPIELRRRLYLAEPDAIFDVISELDSSLKRILVVGHNPGLSELACHLSDSSIQMTTAAIFVAEAKIQKFSSFESEKVKRFKLLRPRKTQKDSS